MKNLKFKGKLISYQRENNSSYGNPKYTGYFENEKGESLKGTTATNASCAYCFLNYQDKERTVTYHVTKGGKVVITNIEIESV